MVIKLRKLNTLILSEKNEISEIKVFKVSNDLKEYNDHNEKDDHSESNENKVSSEKLDLLDLE
jgi:hypothetical protein